MKTVRICCHSCDGNGWVEEKLYPSNATVRILCPECNGRKCVYAEKFEGEGSTEKKVKRKASKRLRKAMIEGYEASSEDDLKLAKAFEKEFEETDMEVKK